MGERKNLIAGGIPESKEEATEEETSEKRKGNSRERGPSN